MRRALPLLFALALGSCTSHQPAATPATDPAAVAEPTEPVTTLPDRTRPLVVELRDETSQPYAPVQLGAYRLEPGADGLLVPADGTLAAREGQDTGALPRIELDARVGARYALFAVAGRWAFVEESYVVPDGTGDLLKTLVLSEGPPARLKPIVRRIAGDALDEFEVVLAAPLAREELFVFGADELDDEGRTPPVPAGRYLVWAEPTGDPARFDLASPPELCNLAPDALTERVFELRAGGRLELQLLPPEGDVGHESPAPEAGEAPARGLRRALLTERHGATVRVTAPGRPGRPGRPSDPDQPDSSTLVFGTVGDDGIPRYAPLLPGQPSLALDLLAPGTYTLRIQTPGYARIEHEVTVRARAITRVDLPLTPE